MSLRVAPALIDLAGTQQTVSVAAQMFKFSA